eukprot:561146-Prymnesium_polylepis.1
MWDGCVRGGVCVKYGVWCEVWCARVCGVCGGVCGLWCAVCGVWVWCAACAACGVRCAHLGGVGLGVDEGAHAAREERVGLHHVDDVEA